MKISLGLFAALIVVIGAIFLTSGDVYSATPTPEAGGAAAAPAEEVTPMAMAGGGYQEIADQFFIVLAQQGGEAAIRYAFSNSPYAADIADQLDSVIQQYTSVEGVMDEYIDHELLMETNVSDRIIVQYYLVMYKRQPLKIVLTFYRPQEEWIFQNFSFDTNVIDDITTQTNTSLINSDKIQIMLP